MTLAAALGIGAAVISIGSLRALAAKKGLRAEHHEWRGRVRLVCRNDAVLRFPLDGHRWSGWQPKHAWRYLQRLPDQDLGRR